MKLKHSELTCKTNPVKEGLNSASFSNSGQLVEKFKSQDGQIAEPEPTVLVKSLWGLSILVS